MKNPEKPAAQHIEWGAVRALAAVVGVREAARRMGISEEQVKKRCTREGWLRSPEARAANQIAGAGRSGRTAAVTVPKMSPAALISAEIAQLGSKTRLSLARGIAKAGEHVESLSGEDILERANDVKAVAQTADLVHGWKDSAPNVKIRLDVLGSGAAEQQIFEMEADVSASESWDNAVDEY
jgi:hypothetical protein